MNSHMLYGLFTIGTLLLSAILTGTGIDKKKFSKIMPGIMLGFIGLTLGIVWLATFS